jgi:hypothetical protein
MLVFQITARDFFALRMCGEPAFSTAEEFFDFVLADPIVFFVVEHGQQDIEMLEEILQALLRCKSDTPIAALAPLRELLIESMPIGGEFVAKRLEQSAEKCLPAPAWDDRDADFQRKFRVRELLPTLAPTAKGSSKRTGEGHACERGGDIRPIVDVLVEKSAFAGRAAGFADESDGIYFD